MRTSVKLLGKQIISSLGFTTQGHYVVFESDDWGAVRIPSVSTLERYRTKYPDHDLDHYQRYDGLESIEDVDRLREVLARYDTASGHPVFTLNFATANPAFDRIEICEPEFGFFTFETIAETYSRYFCGQSVLDSVRSEPGTFNPQLHAREHLNATQWMRGVICDKRLRYAFDLGLLGVDSGKYCAMDALNRNNDAIDRIDYLCEASALFEGYFGKPSESFIPPCYVINLEDCRTLDALGIATLQGGRFKNLSQVNGKLRRSINVFGRQNCYRQIQLIRNCQFEPSKYYYIGKTEDVCVADAMAGLEQAFKFRQPAIFCTHRVNYTSLIDVGNREYSLRCLDRLLERIVREYPDVIFTTSDRLGKFIARSRENGKEDPGLLSPESLSGSVEQ